VLYRGGDVFGPVVNIAAQVASLTRQDTIRVDEAMATAVGDADRGVHPVAAGATPRSEP